MTDLRALLGDKYDETIDAAARAVERRALRDTGYDAMPDERTYAWSRLMAGHALAAVLPDLMARAWDEGAADACADPYHPYGECEPPHVNPYRPTEGDPS